MRSCELFIFDSVEIPDSAKLKRMPTVCLLALSSRIEDSVLESVIKDCLSAGTFLFATYGEFSEELEDQIDAFLERDLVPGVVTTSHQDDTFEDVANFLVNAAFREPERFRCLVFIDKDVPNRDRLLRELKELCVNLSAK